MKFKIEHNEEHKSLEIDIEGNFGEIVDMLFKAVKSSEVIGAMLREVIEKDDAPDN